MNLSGWEILAVDETGSTNDDCLQLAKEKQGEFVIWAKHQTAGRGRANRLWYDQAGNAITFSVLMRLKPEELDHLGQFTALGALSLIDVLDTAFSLKAALKWPNDVLVNHRKIAGILTEIEWQGQNPAAMVLGMGINLSDEAFAEAGELRTPATSLEAEGAGRLDEQTLLGSLLSAIRQRRQLLGSEQFMADWNAKLAYIGKRMTVKEYQGKTAMFSPEFVNPDGSLTVKNEGGELISLYSSEFSSLSPSDGVDS